MNSDCLILLSHAIRPNFDDIQLAVNKATQLMVEVSNAMAPWVNPFSSSPHAVTPDDVTDATGNCSRSLHVERCEIHPHVLPPFPLDCFISALLDIEIDMKTCYCSLQFLNSSRQWARISTSAS